MIDDKRPEMKKLSANDIKTKCTNAMVQVNTNFSKGSGFFISGGTIVTNYHTIEGASSIQVQLRDKRIYDVEYILGYSKKLDIALLRIPVETDFLPINNYSLKVGEEVYAVGSPIGNKDAFNKGKISDLFQYHDEVEYIHVDADITDENSGGPLVNAYGEVIGINAVGIGSKDQNCAIDIYQIYQVDTSNPRTVSDYYNELSSSVEKTPPVNPLIANAPFRAQEQKFGEITVIYPKDWSCYELARKGNDSITMFCQGKAEGSNIILGAQVTDTVPPYDVLKKYYESRYTPDYITSLFALNGYNGVAVSGLKISDYASKNGTAIKIEYSVSFKIEGKEYVIKQVLYDLYINNYLIDIAVTDVGDGTTPDINVVGQYMLDTIQVPK